MAAASPTSPEACSSPTCSRSSPGFPPPRAERCRRSRASPRPVAPPRRRWPRISGRSRRSCRRSPGSPRPRRRLPTGSPRSALAISSVARAVWPARCFTSTATTAKPLPCSPARAASIVAFSASRLVCPATVWIRVDDLADLLRRRRPGSPPPRCSGAPAPPRPGRSPRTAPPAPRSRRSRRQSPRPPA